MDEIQRLAHVFGSTTSPNSIVTDKIMQAQTKHEKLQETFCENMCDSDTFKSVLQTFDPTLILFKRWGKLKQAKMRYEMFLQQNRDKLRG